MFENLDALIEINLKLLYNHNTGSLFLINKFKDVNGKLLSRSDYVRLSEIMCEKGLLNINNQNSMVAIPNEYGFKIHKEGGWLKYVSLNEILKQTEIAENHIKRAKERLERDKLVIDYKLSKWKAKTFWWIFGFALFGGVYSAIDLISNLNKKDFQKEQITIEQMESELSKLRTLILDKKNIDSLSNSKTKKNP
jgi:hypothetical protein